MHETEMIRKRFTKPLRDAFGHRIVLQKMGGGAAMQGFIDVVGSFDGTSIWMEAKKEGGKPTALQLDALKRHANSGGLSIFVEFVGRGQVWRLVAPDDGRGMARGLDPMLYALAREVDAKIEKAII